MEKFNTLNVATALAGALALVSAVTPASAQNLGALEVCFGIALAGQNSCANQLTPISAKHSCAGQAKINFDGTEWRAVLKGMCEKLGGKLEAFQGVNNDPRLKKG